MDYAGDTAGAKILFILFCFSETESLKCYKCLAVDCGSEDEMLCAAVRSYILETLKPYYDYGANGYVAPCSNPDYVVEWTSSQFDTPACPRIQSNSGKDEATCSVGRIQVITRKAGEPKRVTSHATILGCMSLNLLTYMKPYTDQQACSILPHNSTLPVGGYTHSMELENCPKISDYCNTVNFCVPPREAVVKPFRPPGKDSSFEIGIVIAIVAVIFVIFIVLILASVCKHPLKRSVNYSPARAQVKLTSIESSPS